MGWAVGLCACASAVRLAPPCARYAPPRMSQGAGATPAQKSAFGAESSRVAPGSSVLLVGALIKRRRHQTNDAAWSVDDSLDELGRLCDTALLEPLGRLVQTMQSPSPSTFIGSGKLDERIYTELSTDHPIDLTRYQVANCYMGRCGLIHSGGASEADNLCQAVRTAVISKRGGVAGLVSFLNERNSQLEKGPAK